MYIDQPWLGKEMGFVFKRIEKILTSKGISSSLITKTPRMGLHFAEFQYSVRCVISSLVL